MKSPEGAQRTRLQSSSSRRSWQRGLRGYLLLPHLVPIIMVELATLGFAVIAWGGVPPLGLLARLLLAMLGGQLAIGAINEIVDFPDDAVGKPQKPLPSGDVSIAGAKVMVAFGLALMAILGMSLGMASISLLVLGTGLGIAYDLWLKRSPWSWLPYLLALPLLPIWVFLTLGRSDARLLLLYPLGALAAVGVHFAQALPDVNADKEAGLQTLTSRLGAKVTFAAAWVTALVTPLIADAFASRAQLTNWPGVMTIATATALLLAAANVGLLIINRRWGERVCFALVAISLLVSGLSWTWSVAR